MGIEINKLAKSNHKLALKKGFWDDEELNVSYPDGLHIFQKTVSIDQTAQKLGMIHCEISEAFEESRKTDDYTKVYYSKGHKPEGFGIELADALMRILDLAERRGVDMEKCICLKIKYNKTRPYKHGKRY
jgi:hypothetical protein